MFAWDVLQTPNMEAGATAPKEADRTLLVRTTASGCYTAVDPTQLEAGGATSTITLDVASTPHKAGAAVDPGVKNVVRGAPVVLRGMQDGRSLYIDDANLPQRSGLRMHAIAFEDSKSSDTGGDLSYRSLVRVVCYEFGAEPMYVPAYQKKRPSTIPLPSQYAHLACPTFRYLRLRSKNGQHSLKWEPFKDKHTADYEFKVLGGEGFVRALDAPHSKPPQADAHHSRPPRAVGRSRASTAPNVRAARASIFSTRKPTTTLARGRTSAYAPGCIALRCADSARRNLVVCTAPEDESKALPGLEVSDGVEGSVYVHPR